MKRPFLTILILCFLATSLVTPLHAQEADPPQFRQLSLADGLSQSSVQAITQDSRGFIWLGTEDGLNRYDGRSFITYYPDPNSPNSLSNNNIQALVEDNQQRLWIGTHSGLDQLDATRTQFSSYLRGQTINNLLVDSAGVVWAGTAVGGLFTFDPATNQFTPIGPPQGITALAQDELGQLWVGTATGLARVRPGTQQLEPRPLPWLSLNGATIQAILPRGTALWLGTTNGLYDTDLATGRTTLFQNDADDSRSLPANNIYDLLLDDDDQLWVGTQDGLARFNFTTQRFERFQKSLSNPNSLSENWINALFLDRGRVLWVGTTGGGASLHSPSTQKFGLVQANPEQPGSSLSGNFVLGMCQDDDGNLWVGTLGHGLNRRDAQTGAFTHFQHDPEDAASIPSDMVFTLLCHGRSLWISTFDAGLVRMDLDTFQFTTYRHDPTDPTSLPGDEVSALLPNPNGTIWVGTWNGGLALLDPENGRFTPRQTPGAPQRVWSLAQDENRMWVGTWNGLLVFDKRRNEWQQYSHDPDDPTTLSNNLVIDIHLTPTGDAWIGTADGLNYLAADSRQILRYTTADGLPNNTIYAILPDENGRFWISTNRGLSHFDPITVTFRNFDVSDGLQSNEFNRSAAYRATDGQLFFGGINGYNHFYPDQIVDNPHAPPVVITTFGQFGEITATDLPDGQTLQLSHEDNFITFEFAALDYAAPEQNRFAYQMVGFDPDWIESGTQFTRSYTNLAPGTYTFRVRASNNDGVWNETGTAVQLIITPPVWQTLWFRLTAVALPLLLLAAGYRWRIISIKQQNQRLTTEVEQRTAELAALLQTGQTLAGTLSLEPLLLLILEQLQEVVGFAASAIAVLENNTLSQVEYIGPASRQEALSIRIPVSALGPIWQKLSEGQAVTIADIQDRSPEARAYRQLAGTVVNEQTFANNAYLHAWLAVPLRRHDVTLGILALQHPQPGYFTPERSQLARAFADQAAIALENARLYAQAQQLAALEERQKLARELHDSVSQALYGISLGTRTALKRMATMPADAQTRLDEPLAYILQQAEAGLTEMRALIFELRPESLESEGLVMALEKQTAALRARHAIPVLTELGSEPEVSLTVKEALYRVAQEGLHNIVKHAGATMVRVSLVEENGRLTLMIHDNGHGFEVNGQFPGHLGLKSMSERIARVGGEFHIHSGPALGTTITAGVPI